jgi:hypothetical protein
MQLFNTKDNSIRAFISIFITALIFSACAHQPQPIAFEPPGFFSGLWHGFIILFSLIGSVFSDIRIYAFPNSGIWYDFGFFLGSFAFLGGASASQQ